MRFRLQYRILTQADIDDPGFDPDAEPAVRDPWGEKIWILQPETQSDTVRSYPIELSPELFTWLMEPDEDFYIAWSDAMYNDMTDRIEDPSNE